MKIGTLVLVAVLMSASTQAAGGSDGSFYEKGWGYRLFPTGGDQQVWKPKEVAVSEENPAGPSTIQRPTTPPDSHPGSKLPSDEEFFGAMTANQGGKVETKSPWGPSNPPWGPVDSKGTFPEGRRGHWKFYQFTLPDGRTFGPYDIGGTKFESKPYPLELPFLLNTYRRGKMIPVPFEHYYNGQNFHISEHIFRPDPHVLNRIQTTLHTPLRSNGWTPLPTGADRKVRQGDFLWPPLRIEADKTELDMAVAIRQRIHDGTVSRLGGHSPWTPQMYHLGLPDTGTGRGERHIMMTPVRSEVFTDMPYPNRDSDFYLFHEALIDKHGPQRPKLALLGGMYLPKEAANTLHAQGYIRPAFSHLWGYIH